MKRGILIIGAFLFVASSLTAQSIPVENDVDFRKRMRVIVTEGNRQYERSNRAGIMSAAVELEKGLIARSQSGHLQKNDDLEFTADLYKLVGDWHYENSSFDEDSYPLAESSFLKALSIYETNKDIFGEDLDKAPTIRRELAQLNYKRARYEAAYDNICEALSAFDDAFLRGEFVQGDPLYYVWLDIQMQKAMCMARLGNSKESEIMADSLFRRFEIGSERYYESLRKKAKIIMLSRAPDREKRALPLYKSFYEWKQKDALSVLKGMSPGERQDYWMRMRPFIADCFQLEGEDPGLIFNVALFSKGLLLQLNAFDRDPNAIKSLNSSWKDIQKSLPTDGCAIEFVQYEKDGRQRLGCVLVKKTGLPIWIALLEPECFMEYEFNGMTNEARLYSTSGKYKNVLYEDTVLREMLWPKELQSAIGDCQKVYFSPDGYIHQLAVEYMLPESLASKKFYRLSSTRRLVLKRSNRLNSALIAGGLSYFSEIDATNQGNDILAYTYLNKIQAYFGYLFGAKEEAERIYTVRGCASDTLLMGNQASESVIRSLMGKYSIVSISTHGFFDASEIPQGTDIKPCLTDETLSQSSLALSGANKTLWDFTFDPNHFDGILSAAEIATLDLSKVDLAIISACQTALGKVTAEGVYGIQRGLKNAGVGAMLVSLWNVSDKATAELIVRFHGNLVGGMDMHDAYMAARASLSERNDNNNLKIRKYNPKTMTVQYVQDSDDFNEPQYYDAFILIDAI
jgi:CHAT domain-containing protein